MRLSRLLPTLAVMVGLAALPAAVPAQDSYRIIANVNSQGITQYELEQRVKLTMVSSRIADSPTNRAQVQRQVLRQMIDERIQLDEAQRAQIKVTPSEIRERVQQLEQANRMAPGGIEQALRGSGIGMSVLTSQIEAGLAWGKLVRRRVRGQIDVTDAEIDEALNQIRRNVGKSENRVAEIFLAVDRPDQADEVLRNAQRILEQIRVGTPFSVMAQQFSQSASAANGGDLGWVLPGQFDPVLEAAIARLQPGRVTEQPVRSAAGWHILALVDRRTFGAAGSNNPAEVRVNVAQLLLPLPPNASQDEIARGTAEAQKIMAQVTKCADLRSAAARTRGATASNVDKLRVGDLPANVAQQIATTPVGRAMGPFAIQGAIQILVVCSKEGDGGLPSRDAIQQQILTGKLEAAARRYMRDLRRAAIIEIRG
ncbi:MAG: peptidylprolyl isomerase [Alphaproteobacteria bacterium]|nr:peptidylprolyl isomerase [Alphaproteobacteria bacterium]